MNHLIRFKHVFAKRLIWVMFVCAFLGFLMARQGIMRAQTFDPHASTTQRQQVSPPGTETPIETEHPSDPDLTGDSGEDQNSSETPGTTEQHESTEDEVLLRPPR